MKCKCKNIIPIQRVNLGYNTCVNCSTTERYGCAPLINHKTGNSIQIMSSEDAAKIGQGLQDAVPARPSSTTKWKVYSVDAAKPVSVEPVIPDNPQSRNPP